MDFYFTLYSFWYLKSMKKLALLFLSVLLTSNVFAMGGDCSSAIFQVENATNSPLTFSGFASSNGAATVISNTGAAGTLEHPTITHLVNVNGPSDSAEDILTYQSISSQDGTCVIKNLQLNLQRSADHNSCKIVNSSYSSISEGCHITTLTEGGKTSYPTLSVYKGNNPMASLPQ